MTDLTLTQSGHKPGIFSSLMASMRARRETRVTRNALYALTDRELDDIGITRGDIEHIARGGR